MFSTGGARTRTYDAAGNVTFDNRNGPGYGYNYDAANRMSSFAINGIRSGKRSIGTFPFPPNSRLNMNTTASGNR